MNIPASNSADSLPVDGILPPFRNAPFELRQRLQRNFAPGGAQVSHFLSNTVLREDRSNRAKED